jgi:ATP-binding cassette subfamily G (WHITE) protein 2 (PDR)
MYRVSPFTYLVSAVLSVGLSGTSVDCSSTELLTLSPPSAGMTCETFLGPYLQIAGGYVTNPNATTNCQLCTVSTTDSFLAALSIFYSDRWRNIGILFAFVGFNIFAAVFLYWLARVPKKRTIKEKQT